MKLKIKILLIIVAFTGINLSNAQKVKVKKGIISIDKKNIAKIDSPYRDHYVFSTMEGKEVFKVDMDGASNGTEEIYHYLKIENSEGTKKAQIEYEVLLTSFNVKRIIAHLLTVKYKVFNSQGIDMVSLGKLFETNQKDLGKKYTTIVVESKQRDLERKKKIAQIRAAYNPQVRSNKQITFRQGGKTIIVGNMKVIPGYDRTKAEIKIYDLDGNLVSSLNTAEAKPASKEYKLRTWDDNQIRYTAGRYYTKDNNAFLQEVVIQLVASGYKLEHQIYKQQMELRKAQLDLAKDNSVNIYGQTGTVKDNKGNPFTGKITIAFQQLDINQTGQKLPEYGPDNYGKKVYVKYKNKKGASRTKEIKAVDGVFFKVLLEDKYEYFYAIKTKGEALKKMQNINSFSFNNTYFYKLLKEEKDIMLLQDPVETQKYVIKIKMEKKGQMIDNRSNKGLSKALSEYMSGCMSLSKEIANEAFDLRNEENLYQIIEEYQKCKR